VRTRDCAIVLEGISQDKKQPGAARVAAARSIAEITGKLTVTELPRTVREIQEMSTAQLHDLVRRLESKGYGVPGSGS
jgi:hypothetical protein